MNNNIYFQCHIKEISNLIENCKEYKIGLDISLTDVEKLNAKNYKKIESLRNLLDKEKIRIVTHLPFYGLDLGCKDKTISEYAVNSLIKGMKVTKILNSKLTVFHSNYIPLIPSSKLKLWFDRFYLNLEKIVRQSEEIGITFAIENTWEPFPAIINDMFEKFPSNNFKFCFDIGHCFVFSKVNYKNWLEELGNYICHFHLSDNDNCEDSHQPLGSGEIDFSEVLEELNNRNIIAGYSLEMKWSGVKQSLELIKSINGKCIASQST